MICVALHHPLEHNRMPRLWDYTACRVVAHLGSSCWFTRTVSAAVLKHAALLLAAVVDHRLCIANLQVGIYERVKVCTLPPMHDSSIQACSMAILSTIMFYVCHYANYSAVTTSRTTIRTSLTTTPATTMVVYWMTTTTTTTTVAAAAAATATATTTVMTATMTTTVT